MKQSNLVVGAIVLLATAAWFSPSNRGPSAFAQPAEPQEADSMFPYENCCCGPKSSAIRSYSAAGDGVVLVPAVEGRHGMIITDITWTTWSGGNDADVKIKTADGQVLFDANRFVNGFGSVSFRSGIPVAAHATLIIDGGATVNISGYVH